MIRLRFSINRCCKSSKYSEQTDEMKLFIQLGGCRLGCQVNSNTVPAK